MQGERLAWRYFSLIVSGNILSENMKKLMRNANIGIAVGVVFGAIAFVFFHDSETAMEALGIAMPAVTLGVYLMLNWHGDRAHARRSGRPH